MSADWSVVVSPKKVGKRTRGSGITILGHKYRVPCDELRLGASFVLPTVASASQAAEVLSEYSSRYKLHFLCEEIVWYDMLAVRVHCIS